MKNDMNSADITEMRHTMTQATTQAMTPEEAIAYINNFGWSTTKLGLERTEELLERLGRPDRKLKFIHVAGTNGKGSTCAMLASILTAAGYRTGFYPSPFIEEFRERIQVDGEMITPEALGRITGNVREQAEQMAEHPTQFELITAIGMVYFAEKKCDIVVLEVGMGGALDSTNVIDPPEAAVITNIGLDHTEYLGSTLQEIAGTKCGIIKHGSSAVSYDNVPEVMEVIRSICSERKVPLYESAPVSDLYENEAGRTAETGASEAGIAEIGASEACITKDSAAEISEIIPIGHSLSGQNFIFRNKEYRLGLIGEYQLKNAAVVLRTIDAMRDRGFDISEDAVERGLAEVKWPARFEVLSVDPVFVLDGGHNPQCAEALAENLRAYLINESTPKCIFLMGVLADKDFEGILDIITPYADRFICLTPDSYRAMSAEKLAELVKGRGIPAKVAENADEAVKMLLEAAAAAKLPAVAFGSLYMAGAVRKAARKYLSRA